MLVAPPPPLRSFWIRYWTLRIFMVHPSLDDDPDSKFNQLNLILYSNCKHHDVKFV